MTSTAKRHLSPFEKNHLLRFGFDPEKIGEYGEMPVEYITGRAEFLGRVYHVTPDVLIPRVETEELVEMILQDTYLSTVDRVKGIEIGTGSGVIGISLAAHWAEAARPFHLVATDVSAPALKLARRNFRAHVAEEVLGTSVTFQQADLFDTLPAENQFDFIVANLPYIPSERLVQLEPSVRDFEPLLALDGGPDGLSIITRLLVQAKKYLRPKAKIFLEVDDTHMLEAMHRVVPEYSCRNIRDQFGKNRFSVCWL